MSRHIEDSNIDGFNPTTEEYDRRFSISSAYKSKTEKALEGSLGGLQDVAGRLADIHLDGAFHVKRQDGARSRSSPGAIVGDILYGYPYSMSLIRLTRVAHSR